MRVSVPHRPRSIALAAAVTLLAGLTSAASAGSARASTHLAPVGIVSATGKEQAAVLAEMKVTHYKDVAGFRFWIGDMGGKPVVDVASGEKDEGAELATWILDTTFHPRATIFSGTAGAQNPDINVGDVTLAGFVVDKDDTHYETGDYQTAYSGVEIHNAGASDVAGAIVNQYGNLYPTPTNAATYKSSTDDSWMFVAAFAGSKSVVDSGVHTVLGTTAVSDATGDATATGTITNKVVVGTIGDANVWTEPLSWIEAQNMLFQTDAEENEGTGFAFANASAGVPWTLVRGISDTPWYPDAYDSKVAAVNAAAVAAHIVATLPAVVPTKAETLQDLSPLANATKAGYLIADQAYFTVSPVTKVAFTGADGTSHTLTGDALAALEDEYTPSAAHLK
jgi:adenosylhomocysteine nucleosidase